MPAAHDAPNKGSGMMRVCDHRVLAVADRRVTVAARITDVGSSGFFAAAHGQSHLQAEELLKLFFFKTEA